MVKSIKAITFLKVLSSGRTCPCLMRCEDDPNYQCETVVKLITGSGCTGTGLICELIASLFAKDLGLPVPQPFLVEIDSNFHADVTDQNMADRFRRSSGMNFGSYYMSPGYTTWPTDRSIQVSLLQDAAEVFAFDLIIQNPDRRRNKPNLLRKGDDLVIFDHEMAFSFLYSIIPDEYPWDGKGMGFARDHVFYNSLKGRDISLDRVQGALEAIGDNRFDSYANTVPDHWQIDNKSAVERIQEYLKQCRNNSSKLFRRIQEVLV